MNEPSFKVIRRCLSGQSRPGPLMNLLNSPSRALHDARIVDPDRSDNAWVGAKQSKNGKPIAIPLNSTALAILRRQIGKHPERVFTYAGKPLGWANTKAWRDALKRAGIENFRWHDLRHTWSTWHRQSGTPTQAAATWRLAIVGDGRTLCASCARPSRERREQDRSAARRLRFDYARKHKGLARTLTP